MILIPLFTGFTAGIFSFYDFLLMLSTLSISVFFLIVLEAVKRIYNKNFKFEKKSILLNLLKWFIIYFGLLVAFDIISYQTFILLHIAKAFRMSSSEEREYFHFLFQGYGTFASAFIILIKSAQLILKGLNLKVNSKAFTADQFMRASKYFNDVMGDSWEKIPDIEKERMITDYLKN